MRRAALMVTVAAVAAMSLAGVGPATGQPAATMPVYQVMRAGLTEGEARNLANAFDVPRALDPHGAFRFVSEDLGGVPMERADGSELPLDEGKMETTPMAFDMPAIRRLPTMAGEEALARMREGLAQAKVQVPGDATPRFAHSTLRMVDREGRRLLTKAIDTSVFFEFTLGKKVPLVGPGARLRLTYSPFGDVTELQFAARHLEQGREVPVMTSAQARRKCAEHYPLGSRLSTRMVYYAPPLEMDVGMIAPHFQCMGSDKSGNVLVPALIPAVAEGAPSVQIRADSEGRHVEAQGTARGGTRPYSFSWQSSTTDLTGRLGGGASVAYDVTPREPVDTEVLTLTVMDANGLIGTDQVEIPIPLGQQARPAVPGAVGPLDVGAELNVYEWDCVKQSSAGFSTTFGANGIPVAFKYTGTNAWERDFRQTGSPTNGDDADWIDNVDLAWYTGHGSPNSFTFDNTTQDDGSIVVADARYGDRDLEWLQLESCQVLRFTNSSGTEIWYRWAQVFDGLHMLNGFHTNASCVNVFLGTAGRFASWLLGRNLGWVTLPPLKVRQAWRMMAIELEPSGTTWVNMGAIGPNGISNYDDYFWGEGPVGPDIPKSQITAYWWIGGTV